MVFILWVWLIIVIIGDIFRSPDLGGWGKSLWTVLILVLPWIGIVVYLLTRGGSMSQRQAGRSKPAGSGEPYAAPIALSNERTNGEIANLPM